MDGWLPWCRRSWPAGAKRRSPQRDLGPLGTLLVAGIRLLLGGAAVKHVYIQSRLCNLLLLSCTYTAVLQLCEGLCGNEIIEKVSGMLKHCGAH